MQNVVVLYHANCADGFGAAYSAWKYLGNDAQYIPISYQDIQDFDPYKYTGDTVYILDFSFPRQIMNTLFGICDTVVWLDHHKSAFEMYGKTPNAEQEAAITGYAIPEINPRKDIVILDNNRSGALIAWQYFHPRSCPPMFIQHIDDYDRWQFKLRRTKEFNKALWSHAPWSFEQWKTLVDVPSLSELYRDGEVLMRAHAQQVESILKASAVDCTLRYYVSVPVDNPHEDGKMLMETRFVSFPGAVANCSEFLASDVGHELANLSGTYGLCWYLTEKKMVKVSLRSNGDYDVSAIAKIFGGGGHKNAAGFSVTPELFFTRVLLAY